VAHWIALSSPPIGEPGGDLNGILKLCAFVGALSIGLPASAAVEGYLKLEGIDGASKGRA
jgi:hypothetical protein